MKDKHIIIEQLYQELLAQDPSLANHKKEYIWLLERMSDNIPEIKQDPLFFWTLKHKITNHFTTTAQPIWDQNFWHKFFLYWFPTLAIGVALLYVLPIISLSSSDTDRSPIVVDQRTWITNDMLIATDDTSVQEQAAASTLSVWQETSQQDYNPTVQPTSYHSKEAIPPEPTLARQVDQDQTPESVELSDDTSLMMYSVPSEDTSFDNEKISPYTRWTNSKQWQVDYNIYYDKAYTRLSNGVFADGLLRIKSCDRSFTLQDPISLSRWPNLRHITAIPLDTIDSKSYGLIFTIIDEQIMNIEWYEQLCQK